MNVKHCKLPGPLTILPDVRSDSRGFFKETFRENTFGSDVHFVQDSVSFSRAGVLRGLHGDPDMAKLVQCLSGTVYDVIVDCRAESSTYGQWEGFWLTGGGHTLLFVPRGFLHGFYVVSAEAIFSYKQSAYHDPKREVCVRWDDPNIGITWPMLPGAKPIISEKDANAMPFCDTVPML